MTSRLGFFVAVVAVVAFGCRRASDERAGDAGTTGALMAASATRPRATPSVASSPSAGVMERADAGPVEVEEERAQPSWVPEAGRLTIVEAPDLAENLGLTDAGVSERAAQEADASREAR